MHSLSPADPGVSAELSPSESVEQWAHAEHSRENLFERRRSEYYRLRLRLHAGRPREDPMSRRCDALALPSWCNVGGRN